MGNTLGISKTYLRFFVNTHNERYVILVGGRRSGKTYSTLRWLWFLGSAEKLNIMIAAASNSQLLATIQDFQDCLGFPVQGSVLLGHHYQLSNGTMFQFKSFDEYTKCVGQKADILFLNEAINLDEKSFSTLVQGITRQIILNYNPTTKNSWIEKFVSKDGTNRLRTTWKDNDYLTPQQIDEFEAIKERAMKPTATPFDIYNYNVFYKGIDADMGGKTFPILYTCTDEEYEHIDSPECHAIDFGFQESRDQTAMAGVKVWNNCLYCKEYIYDNMECQKDINLARRLRDLGINEYVPLACDYGGNGKARIHNLVSACDGQWTEEGISHGFYCFNVKKGSVLEGLKKITNFDKIILTESSVNLRNEMSEHELKDDGKEVEKYANHLVSCVRYAVMTYNLI
jgi:phage terminase large subunit